MTIDPPRALRTTGPGARLASARRRPVRRPGFEPLEGRALLATFTVTSLADSGPGSLREAIERANLEPDRDAITFAPGVTGRIDLVSALPDLTDLSIAGPGPGLLTVARAGASDFRIVTVPEGARVDLSGLTLTGGRTGPGGTGGGVSNAGTLTIADSIISGNSADPIGGGIANSGVLMVSGSTISQNSVRGPGDRGAGGISNSHTGVATISDSTIVGNSATGDPIGPLGSAGGGGIGNAGTMTISGSTISGNLAAGLHTRFGPTGRGGGISNGGMLTITNSTISGNTANEGGDGISNRGTLRLVHATLSGNRLDLGTSTVTASIFAESPIEGPSGAITSLGHNLFSDAPDIALAPTDRIDTNPMLAPLADYGGPTQTHALRAGSPAIDASVAVEGVATDQRGIARPQGEAPDIGAYEQAAGVRLILTERDFPNGPVGVPRTVGVRFPLGPGGGPLAGVPVSFRIVGGPNAGGIGATDPPDGRTDAEGRIRFTYDGPNGPGEDTIVATAMTDNGPVDSPPITVRRFLPAATADYDGDGRSDFAVFESDREAGNSRFVIELSGVGSRIQPFGGLADRPIVGDFDGDGTTDLAVFGFSPIDGFSRYALIRSSDGAPSLGGFGGPADRPVIGDFDGDGRDDLAVYGPDLDGNNRFAVIPSSDPAGAYLVPFGGPGDLPLAGDFDGDGLDDLAVYGFSPLDGFSRFAVRPSGDPSAGFTVAFGGAGDGPVVGDYDGDGTDDLAVYGFSPLDGFSRFAIRPSGRPAAAYPVAFGGGQDAPIGADFDGDGTADVAVYGFSPLDGEARFAVLRSSDGGASPRPLGMADSLGLPIAPGRFRPPSTMARAASARLREAPVVAMEGVSAGPSAVGSGTRRAPVGSDWSRLIDEALGRLGEAGPEAG